MIMRNKYNRAEIYPNLIQSLHSSNDAEDFFRNRLQEEAMLATLIEIALEDESDDARMEAAFWVSQFAADLLEPHENDLMRLSRVNWESIANHARTALNKLTQISAFASGK